MDVFVVCGWLGGWVDVFGVCGVGFGYGVFVVGNGVVYVGDWLVVCI